MRSEDTAWKRGKFFVGIAAVSALSACGGGSGNSVTSGPPEFNVSVTPIESDGGSTTFAGAPDGAQFAYHFIDADFNNGGDPGVARGIIRIEKVDDDTLTLTTIENGVQQTVTLTRSAGTTFVLSEAPDFEYTLTEEGPHIRLEVSDSPDFSASVGGFGYATSDMPVSGSGTYATNDSASILLTASNDPFGYTELSGDVDLTVDFASGTVSGDVFSGTGSFDVDGDDADDTLTLTVEIANGEISGNTFSGGVAAGDAEVQYSGASGTTTLDFSLSRTDLDGAFIGNTAEALNGTWGANYELSDGDDTVSGQAVGYFEAEGVYKP